MAGLISEEEDFFKISFPFNCEQHEVHSLRSLADTGLVGLALAGKLRAAEELQAALDAAAPGRQGQPSFRMPRAASQDSSRLPPAPFCQLVKQLQACVDWRNEELAGLMQDESDGMGPLCGLLAAAVSLGCTDVRRVRVLLPGDVAGRLLCLCLAD
ncbi:hypothetical protein ABPG77_003583 [Micractinium sp. CCAP 211/92]